jgi:hypothetical protein
MNRTDIIDRARIALNDMLHFADAQEALPKNLPAKPVEAYTNEAVDLAMQEMLLIAPLKHLKLTTMPIYADGVTVVAVGSKKKYAVVELPTNYLRFGSLYLAGWTRPVEALGDERERTRQYFQFTMTAERSPCAYEDFGRGRRTIDAFPLAGAIQTRPSGGTPPAPTSTLLYVPAYDWGLSDETGHGSDAYMADVLLEGLIYSIATKVMTYFGRDATGIAALYARALEVAKG